MGAWPLLGRGCWGWAAAVWAAAKRMVLCMERTTRRTQHRAPHHVPHYVPHRTAHRTAHRIARYTVLRALHPTLHRVC